MKLVGKDNKEVTLDLLHFKSPLRSKVVVLTLSGRSKFSIRQTIRKTWKKHWKNVFFCDRQTWLQYSAAVSTTI